MRVNIYIDTSIKGMRRTDGVVGFILEDAERKDNTLTQFGYVSDVTENESYLIALKFALRRVKERSEIEVWSDSKHLAAAFQMDWISGWKENGWKNAKGKDVANRQHWEEIAKILGERSPRLRTSEAHTFKLWLSAECKRRAEKRSKNGKNITK